MHKYLNTVLLHPNPYTSVPFNTKEKAVTCTSPFDSGLQFYSLFPSKPSLPTQLSFVTNREIIS